MSKNKDPLFEKKLEMFLRPLNSADELRDWMYVFFDIQFPKGVVYPTSTHGPVEAMWRIYELIKTGKSAEIPEVVMLSSRDSGKTLGAAAVEVLILLHFRLSICNLSAITSQSDKTVSYINGFFRKISVYLEALNWKSNSENKRMISWITDKGEEVYIKVVVATLAGANSEHTPLLFCVDGKTKIPVKNYGVSNTKKKKRSRIFNTARGIYYSLNRGENVEVVSFNHEKSIFEFKKCIKAQKTKKDIYRVSFSEGGFLDASNDHPVYVIGKGYVKINDIQIGDKCVHLNKARTLINHNIEPEKKIEISKVNRNEDELQELILGSLLGDGGIYRQRPKKQGWLNNCYFNENHCIEQADYLKWKYEVFKKNGFNVRFTKNSISGYTGKKQIGISTGNNKFFNQFINFKNDFHKTKILENMGPQALAVWYQDDGYSNGFSIASHGFTVEQNEYLSELINKKFGFNTYVRYENKKDGRSFPYIAGRVEDKIKLKQICEDFFHPEMMFKLKDIENSQKECKICNKKTDTREIHSSGLYCSSQFCQLYRKEHILIKTVKEKKFLKFDDVFDFTVEDNHNFIANGILVHNCDEIDVISNQKALEEAKMIPTAYKGFQPLTVYLSTLKFAGGLMQKTMDNVQKSGGEILRWNILDITERISPEEAKINEPKVIRYISDGVPLENISEEDWLKLNEEKQTKYQKIEAYAGIANHPMLSVMRNYLVDRPQDDVGGLYKTLQQTYNNFKKLSPDMADAQLLCNKPSSSGLVYPRFGIENTLTLQEAYKKIFDIDDPDVTLEQFREAALSIGAEVVGGADWGYTDFTSLVVMMLIDSNVYIVDSFYADQLELDDIVKYAKELNEKWNINKWYVDQAYPAYIATLKRHGLTIPTFKKVVEDGIAALQYRICDSNGKRRFFVIKHPDTSHIIQSFNEYKWATDSKGDIIEGKPYHDDEYISDVQDSIRYPMQVLFGKPKRKPQMTISAPQSQNKPVNDNYGQQIMDYVKATTGADIKTTAPSAPTKKKGLVWSV